MTAPGGRQGTAYITFLADTSKVEPGLERALRQAADDADDFLDKTGERWGDTVSDSMSGEIKKHGKDFADSVEHAMAGQVITLSGNRFKVDRRGFLHDFDTGQFAGKIVDEVVDAFSKASTPGGPFSRVGEGIADAVGAGFNVSGRSPLIAVLIPALGAIAGLILGAVQAANALLAVITAIPALLSAIALQVGVVMLAFEGVGEAVKGAFAAKNAQELQAAIAGLTPAAQTFVKSLLPLRDLFAQIKATAQQNFFAGFGDTLTRVAAALGPIFAGGQFANLANAMGNLFRDLGLFFGSPTFVGFVKDLIPATVRWLSKFGPQFVSLLTAVFGMADKTIPFLERLGDTLGSMFNRIGSWLQEQIKTGNLTDWLDRMSVTLDKVVDLFFAAAAFVTDFMEALDKNGGNEILDTIIESLILLGHVFSDPMVMKGIVQTVILMIEAFVGLVVAIASVIAFFTFLATAVEAFFTWLTGPAAETLAKFFNEDFPAWLESLWAFVVQWWEDLTAGFEELWNKIIDGAKDIWNDFLDFWRGVPDGIMDAIGDLGNILYDAGKAILEGLWAGAKWAWDNTVGPFFNWVTQQIPQWKGPEDKDARLLEPAGKAVMEGFGRGLRDGARDVKDMLTTFTDMIQFRGNVAANNTFNTNLNFNGQQPTTSQAEAAGRAVTGQLDNQIAQRDMRLAVRTM